MSAVRRLGLGSWRAVLPSSGAHALLMGCEGSKMSRKWVGARDAEQMQRRGQKLQETPFLEI